MNSRKTTRLVMPTPPGKASVCHDAMLTHDGTDAHVLRTHEGCEFLRLADDRLGAELQKTALRIRGSHGLGEFVMDALRQREWRAGTQPKAAPLSRWEVGKAGLGESLHLR